MVSPQNYKYKDLNLNFFDVVDTEEKAYFLGFLYADGCVSDYTVSLKLQKRDQMIVERFRDLISPTSPIKLIENKYSGVRIHSKPLCQQLINLGCFQRKSLILKFPHKLEDRFISHFIRGYSDGDGTITYSLAENGRKDFAWKITSTKDFCQSVSDLLFQTLQINCPQSLSCPKNNNLITTTLSVGGSLQLMKVLGWIYKDATVYLPRKYDKYLEFKQQIQSNRLQTRFSDRGSFLLDNDKIISLYSSGLTKRKVAKLMDCDVRSVFGILKENNVATIKRNSSYRENSLYCNRGSEIVELYNGGTAIKDIAKIMDCTPSNIGYILKKNGIVISKKIILTTDQADQIIKLHNEGLGTRKIAVKMDIDRSFIKRFLQKMKAGK